MSFNLLQKEDQLSLTCSRKGTCCHGNNVYLNPWEIAMLAQGVGVTVLDFISNYTILNGIKLKFNGTSIFNNKKSCNLYNENQGCSIHENRPLACRLFPLGRMIQNNESTYMFQGNEFPCNKDCPEVSFLPKLTVEEYLKGQNVATYEIAQDEYLEVVQNIADIALMLFLDTGLSESGDEKVLQKWTYIANHTIEKSFELIEKKWLNLLLNPNIEDIVDVKHFINKHNVIIQQEAQIQFGNLPNMNEVREASYQMFSLALILSKSIGANHTELGNLWIQIATENS